MADNSLNIQEPYDFRAYTVPAGTKNYIPSDLTADQQQKFNTFKINRIRENHRYLANHPEIRALISIILRLLMKSRPVRNFHEIIARYFLKPSSDIRDEVDDYIVQSQGTIGRKSFTQLNEIVRSVSEYGEYFGEELEETESEKSSEDASEVSDNIPMICRDIVEDIVGTIVESYEYEVLEGSWITRDISRLSSRPSIIRLDHRSDMYYLNTLDG